MRTRDQIIAETLRGHQAACGGPDAYSEIIQAALEKRLAEAEYLTCEDFDHFDVTCCTAGCESEPHYERIDVTLDEGQHAWVCCAIRDILIRQTKPPLPRGRRAKKRSKLLAEIFGGKPDTVADQLHAANSAAQSDEQKLYYCLKYAHHKSGGKRGDQKLEALVQRALMLPGGCPARYCDQADPPKDCGLCLQCGGLIYAENLIPRTQFHNCKRVRELLRMENG